VQGFTYPTRYPGASDAKTDDPTMAPTATPTLVTVVLSEEQIFGFDVGSRAANVITLVALILLMVWLALSTAYCLTRRKPGNEKKIVRKSRQQKFEEYWGEIDDTAHSSTALNVIGDSMHSDSPLRG